MIHVDVVYSYDHLEVFLNKIIKWCEIIAITQNGDYYTIVYKEKK